MKYAVMQLAGKQYKVSEGDQLDVALLNAEEGKELVVSDVLLTVDGDKAEVGVPLVKNAKITLKVVTHGRDEKIRVFKYRAKSRYRRVHGHKQDLTTVKVVSIG